MHSPSQKGHHKELPGDEFSMKLEMLDFATKLQDVADPWDPCMVYLPTFTIVYH